jgi:succinate dehydrogenase hydrophobic anchor subunit
MHEHVPTDWHRLRGMLVLPPILALVYPFLLQGFHASVAAILLRVGGAVAWSAAAITLILAFAMPISALFIAMSLAAVDMPTAAQRKARKVALLTVAAPPIFVFLGVVLDMLHSPIPDTWFWVAGWAAAYIVVTFADNTSPIMPTPAVVPSWLRYAHGVSAACIILMFLLLHLTNHLLFVEGEADYMLVMKLFRHIYRGVVVQPILVALLLFQVASGLYLAIRRASAPMDRFRSFQVASGVFLAFYIIGHMDSVFIFARTFSHIDSDWGFATGAPTGLIEDPWNIRLVPHYGLAVFFILAHLFSGLRVIMLAHGARERIANRVTIGGAVAAALTAGVIMLGMCGMRVSFALPA